MKSIRKPALWAAVALLVAAGAIPAAHAETTTFKLALSTGPNHVRNIMLEGFIEKLRERTRNRLDVEVFPANQLFKGPDVPKALAQGTLEMGVPGLWQIGRFDPNALAPDLPIFYGATRDEIHAVWDGPAGDELRSRLEKKMRVKVIGKFLDLGYGTIFTTEKRILDHSDLVGLKLRTPPGAAYIARYKAFRTNPVSIPFGDVPLALAQNTVDGLMSTHESIRSAKLWDSGLKYSYDDRQGFLSYVPMVSGVVWKELEADVRTIIVDTWAEVVGPAREFAEARQAEAREVAAQNGMVNTQATPESLSAMRRELIEAQPAVVEELGMDPDFVERVANALDAARGG